MSFTGYAYRKEDGEYLTTANNQRIMIYLDKPTAANLQSMQYNRHCKLHIEKIFISSIPERENQ